VKGSRKILGRKKTLNEDEGEGENSSERRATWSAVNYLKALRRTKQAKRVRGGKGGRGVKGKCDLVGVERKR